MCNFYFRPRERSTKFRYRQTCFLIFILQTTIYCRLQFVVIIVGIFSKLKIEIFGETRNFDQNLDIWFSPQIFNRQSFSLARIRYDFPFTLRFLRNFRKLSIKNTTKLENSPTRYDFFRVYRNVYVPGTLYYIGYIIQPILRATIF